MQRSNVLLVSLAVLAVALAGCSDAPPSGEFSTAGSSITVTGAANVDYQEKVRPAGEIPTVGEQACPPEQIGGQTGTSCSDPHTKISADFTDLPLASDYKVYLTSSAGSEDIEVGSLEQNGTSYSLAEMTYEEDYSADYDTLELRIEDLLIATAPANEGSNTFELNGDLEGMTVEASWTGKEITITVAGGLEGVAYTAYLYEQGEEGGIVQSESFPAGAEGEFTHTASKNIDEFVAFHVHVSGTAINVAQGPIE